MFLRFCHCNGSRLIFLLVYIHIYKGMYYSRYRNNNLTWLSGSIIYLLIIFVAFLGYVLPWGQIRYWGATVIRSLITTIPSIGKWLLVMIWGDYSVNNRTLNRFYTLHFVIPFILIILILLHLILLHNKGRTSLIRSNKLILPFRSYFFLKDLVGLIVMVCILIINIIYFPGYFLDSENSIRARSLVTPIHIVPEWYFLFAYCILKSFERKAFGVIILLLRLAIFPLISLKAFQRNNFNHKVIIIIWLTNFIILTKIGAIELLYPYVYLRKLCTVVHFLPLLI